MMLLNSIIDHSLHPCPYPMILSSCRGHLDPGRYRCIVGAVVAATAEVMAALRMEDYPASRGSDPNYPNAPHGFDFDDSASWASSNSNDNSNGNSASNGASNSYGNGDRRAREARGGGIGGFNDGANYYRAGSHAMSCGTTIASIASIDRFGLQQDPLQHHRQLSVGQHEPGCHNNRTPTTLVERNVVRTF